jgi:F-type H+-transporting ATPase subunit b
MAEPVTASGTAVPPRGGGEFPPFKVDTFPSQLFWLAITFAALLVVVWRFAGPRLGSVIGERKARITGDLNAAAKHKSDAEAALASYQSALAAARVRAHRLAEEKRRQIEAEVEKAKADVEAEARERMTKAEARIAAERDEAARHIAKVAEDAAAAIVARLIGEAVSPAEAEAAVDARKVG